MDNWNQTAFTKPAPNKPAKQPQNFVEALKSIGGYTNQPPSNDLLRPSASEWRKDWLPPEEVQKEAARRQRL